MMAQQQREHVQVVEGDGYAQRRRVVESAPTTRSVLVSRISALIWLFAALIVTVLAFRFVLVLIDANPAPFVDFIYSLSNPFVAPFAGIVTSPGIDVGALIAMVVYTLAAWLLVTLFRLLFADTNRVRKVTTVDYER
jgi:uncharacterized protein YggT (Ycf19 family)